MLAFQDCIKLKLDLTEVSIFADCENRLTAYQSADIREKERMVATHREYLEEISTRAVMMYNFQRGVNG